MAKDIEERTVSSFERLWQNDSVTGLGHVIQLASFATDDDVHQHNSDVSGIPPEGP